MANKLKYKIKKKKYYCSNCETATIEHNGESDVTRRCKICKKDCVFIPFEEEW